MAIYVVAIISILVVAFVLILSLVTISKGYAYKHSVDPLPDEEVQEQNSEEKEVQ
ncbi:Ca2+/H+ antiporter [Virgibacillus natechei]|uniref:Ca2+/H+ antiporter n=1 Tax=Virgibacillus natechei TaxID=1216297 RepID=A0ABS4IC77_9BACI|nr:YtzI protein [Virgibacillus natechei]MBP1968551.1 Ca2+/H+ antiporter [Virgibacillus natechei]UZD13665.1 YtzI protein [Virgibacillus natechei]